jgi:uncharacterized membrane protein
MENPSKELFEEWQKNPKYWKCKGLFYFNKDDKRIIVDKPNPNYGTTLNFANKKAYLFLIGMFCFFGFVAFMITKNK